MRLEWPTYEQIRSLVQTIWQSERPNADATRYSDLWLYSRSLAKVAQRMHWTMDRVLAALHPATTWGEYLDAWLWIMGLPNGAGGYGRITAKGSTGRVSVTATGVTVDLQGQQLVDEAARVYEITESYAFAGAPWTVDLACAAVTTGLATNLETGDSMIFSSPPANVTAAATAYNDFSGGVDLEKGPEGRTRLIAHLQTPSASGNVPDWVTTIQSASPGELDAFVWPWRQNQPTGWGLTDFLALQRGASRAARHIASTDALYATIAAAVAAKMPTEHYRYSRQLTITPEETDIDLVIELASYATAAHKCDWDAWGVAGAHKPTVTAVSSVNRTVTASKNMTGWGDGRDVVQGDKVIIGGAQAEVEAVGIAGGLAADTMIKVYVWFGTYDAELNPHPWPTGYDPTVLSGHLNYVTSGGGIIMDVVTALFALADSLGPARGTYASPSIEPWPDTLTLIGVQTAVINGGDGIAIDCTITLPAADIVPTAGSGATTERVVVYDFAVFEEK